MTTTDFEVPASTRARIRKKLRAWYQTAARDLPWRATNDPYRIWISEIMLQQTTVTAVVPYYQRFFATFPTLESLARGDEQSVLKLWEGLGYYSRARNIHKTAKILVQDNQGQFPQTAEELQKLPGIGRYTAGAIVSFAFDKPAPILEANTLRLYCRLVGYDRDPRSTAGQRILWDFAEQIHGRTSPGELNQALMELGATICTPRDPECPKCPVHRECRAFADGKVAEIPVPKEKTVLTDVTDITVAVEKDGHYLLRQRPEQERWAGLWDFPRFEISPEDVRLSTNGKSSGRLISPGLTASAANTVGSQIREQTGITAEIDALITEIRHGVTRYRIHLLCFTARYSSGEISDTEAIRWVAPAEFDDYPLSKTGRKFAESLQSHD